MSQISDVDAWLRGDVAEPELALAPTPKMTPARPRRRGNPMRSGAARRARG